MATPESLEPSRRLQSAAAAERGRLGRELARLDERVDRLGQELEEIEARRDAIRRRLSLLARLGHATGAPAGTPDPPAPVARLRPRRRPAPKALLKGARIREAAVRLVVSAGAGSRPLHYQEWLGLLEEQGLAVAGKDPAATFLTQIGRSPVVRRAGRPGFYALDPEAPARLRADVRAFRAELARPEDSDGTLEELAAERARRLELSQQLARAERNLEEALRVLEGPG